MTPRLHRTNEHQKQSDMRLDLGALLHPAGAFAHPTDVVRDPDLNLNEKRAILASWASDACAVESAPALRIAPTGEGVVTFDDIMDALRSLDEESGKAWQARAPAPHDRRVLADRVPGVFGRRSGPMKNAHHARRADA